MSPEEQQEWEQQQEEKRDRAARDPEHERVMMEQQRALMKAAQEQMKNNQPIYITDERMTRFNISLQEGVDLVLYALENAMGGELYVPKIPSYKITDVATAIAPYAEQKLVGIRPGEKIHEEMITASDSFSTIDLGPYYAILPSDGSVQERYKGKGVSMRTVEPNFAYNSGTNPDFLSVEELRELIRRNVDPKFKPF